jgi:uncharacterized protein YdeI (YjbR/CyaY-like superfamily)
MEGLIDITGVYSKIRRLGDKRVRLGVYFKLRKSDSRWSELNKKRVTKLQKQGLMTEAGIKKVKQAKASGLWNKPDRPQISLDIPKELESVLAKNRKAQNFFDQLAPSYQKQFIGWIAVAKRQETKERRVRESISLLEQGNKLGIK